MKFQGLIYIFFILIKKCTLEYCIGYTGVFKFKNGNMFGGLTAWGGRGNHYNLLPVTNSSLTLIVIFPTTRRDIMASNALA